MQAGAGGGEAGAQLMAAFEGPGRWPAPKRKEAFVYVNRVAPNEKEEEEGGEKEREGGRCDGWQRCGEADSPAGPHRRQVRLPAGLMGSPATRARGGGRRERTGGDGGGEG